MATDTADDDYNPFTEEDIQKILKEEKANSSEEGWTSVKNNEFSEVWKKTIPDKPTPIVKAFLSFPGIPPDKVIELIDDMDRRKEWDKQFPVIDVVETHKHYRVVYWILKMPPGVTDRDLVQHIGLRKDEATNTTYILYKDASHKDRPETKAHTRAETLFSCVIVRPDPDDPGSTKLTTLSQIDMKGWIPHAIVNTFSVQVPEKWRETLATYYKKH